MDIKLYAQFKKEAKRLIKKFPSLIDEIETVKTDLLEDPHHGESIGGGFYKIRVPIASKGVGKRGGARIVTYVQIVDDVIYLVSIYDKNERSDIDDATLKAFLKSKWPLSIFAFLKHFSLIFTTLYISIQ